MYLVIIASFYCVITFSNYLSLGCFKEYKAKLHLSHSSVNKTRSNIIFY